MKTITHKNLTVFLLASLACLLWGSAFPTIKITYSLLDLEHSNYLIKLQFAGYRFLLASIFLLLYLLYQKKSLKLSGNMLKSVIHLGLIQTSLQYFFFFVGVSNTSGIMASIMVSMEAFFAIILPHYFYVNDKLTRNKIWGVIIGFIGIVYINLSRGSLGLGFTFAGEGMMILSAIFASIAAIYAKELSKEIDVLVLTFYQMFFGANIMIFVSSIFVGFDTIHFNKASISYFIYISLISAVAFAIWFKLLSTNPVSRVSIYKFQVPLWGTLLSALLLPNESLNISIIIGLIAVASGIILVNYNKDTKLSEPLISDE
jgi:drug/metabolite transporter (DMT)-like permease